MLATLPGEWLTPSQAANRLDLSTQRVRQLADDGLLKCLATPLGRLIAEEDVERLAIARATRRALEDSGDDGR